MTARDEYIAAFVAARVAAWTKTNAIDPPHPFVPPQKPSDHHLQTWREMAVQQTDCPRD